MSLFKEDVAAEQVLAEFLSAQYFKAGIKATRITDRDTQLKGVDLLFEGEGGLNYKVDEKAQLHYLNNDLPTFALEISYLKNGKLKDGWLFDHKKSCEYYAFIFSIHLNDGKNKLMNATDIKSCDVIFINRLRLLNALSKLGLNKSTCEAESQQLRSLNNGEYKIKHASGFNFQISRQLDEMPVNLIARKKFLAELGQQHFFKQ